MGSNDRSSSRTLARWADLGPLLAGVVLFVVAWQFLDLERQRAADEELAEAEATAEQVAARLSVWLDDRLALLEQSALHRGDPAGRSDLAFSSEARLFIDRVRGFRAIAWVDAFGVVRIVEPDSSDTPQLGQDLTEHPLPEVRRAIERSLDTLLPSRTPIVEFLDGGRGFEVFWPVETPGASYGGVVNGVVNLDLLVAHALPDLRRDSRYVVQLVEEDGTPVFGSGSLDEALAMFRVTRSVAFADRPLRLLLEPRSAHVGSMFGATYVLLLAVSGVLALVLALLLRAYLQRQAALSRQEAYNRLLLDSTSEGLLGVDLLGRCTFCNSAGLALLGHDDADELVGGAGLSWLGDGVPETGRIVSLELFAAIREGRIFETRRARALRRDGEQFDVTLTSNPVREQGVLTGALISFADVTAELREAERAHRLTAVLLQVPEMVALMDPGGQLVFLNPAARNVLGVGDAPCEQINVRTFLDPERSEAILAEVFPSMVDADLWQGEATLRSLAGARVPTDIVVMRHSDHHGQLYFSAIARDLREARRADADRRALEEQFREAQRSESLGLLAGSIAHDFNNMLVGVLGNASLALEHLDRDSAAWRHVAQVQTATEHAAELVGQLLAFSGRGRFEARTIDVGQLVEEMASLLRTSVPRRIALDLACGRARGVQADATQIRQLVMNLITNAADAIHGDGRITISVEDTHWSATADTGHQYGAPAEAGDYLRIRVTDDGVGMAAPVIAHIFDPFFTTKDEGKGLGLAAVLGIVRGHGGFLHLTSGLGEGTTFDVYLPLSPESPSRQEPARSEAATESESLQGTVLLVDDEPGVRSYLEAALETMGFTVLSCEDGAEALEVFRERHGELALVLMDQTMPGLSGDAAWHEMQRIDGDVPGLLMSGYDEVRIEESIQSLGFAGFLQKPFRFQELRDALTEAMASRQTVN